MNQILQFSALYWLCVFSFAASIQRHSCDSSHEASPAGHQSRGTQPHPAQSMPKSSAYARGRCRYRSFLFTSHTQIQRLYLMSLMTTVFILCSVCLLEACSEGGCSQNTDGGADPLSNCTYRCHPTSRVWSLHLLQLPVWSIPVTFQF